MKKIVLLVGVMFLGAAHMSAQKSWTLQDCIDYALENNITLKKSQLQKQSASEDLKGAKAALLPRPPYCQLSMPLPTKAWAISPGRIRACRMSPMVR